MGVVSSFVNAVGFTTPLEWQSAGGMLFTRALQKAFRQLAPTEVPKQIQDALQHGTFLAGLLDSKPAFIVMELNPSGSNILAVAVYTPERVFDEGYWTAEIQKAFGELSPASIRSRGNLSTTAVDPTVIGLLGQWVRGELS